MTADIFAAVDATWAPASMRSVGSWTIREGRGGGQRVSAASADGPVAVADIPVAEAAMRALDQHPLFMVRGDQPDLDAMLADVGYAIKDPVDVWVGPATQVAEGYARSLAAIFVDYPMPILAEIWAAGGIGPGRLDVMRRVAQPKTCILGRLGDRPRGALFVAAHDGLAMAHAVEVRADARRQGVAERMMRAAAWWALQQGADRIAALTVQTNARTQSMWQKLGMQIATRYHYRIKT